MAITMMDVRFWLDPDEVDYTSAKRKLGSAAIPYLMELVRGADLGLASKATYLVSMIKSDQTPEVMKAAAKSSEPLLRVAAASGIRNLPSVQAVMMVDELIDDQDVGVRNVLVKSAARFRSRQMVARMQKMAEMDPEPFVRELAESTVRSMKSRR